MTFNFRFRLRDLRREANITGDELAKQLNTTKTAISEWENGKSHPSKDKLIKLADIFNVSVDYLLGNSDVRNAEQELNYNIALYSDLKDLTQEQKDAIKSIVDMYKSQNKAKKGE